MSDLVKILILLAVVIVMAYPLLPLPIKMKRVSALRGLRYDNPDNRKNFVFLFVIILEFLVIAVLFSLINDLVAFLYNIPFVAKLFSKIITTNAEFVIFAVKLVVFNIIILYGYVIAKGFLKKAVFDPSFGIKKEKKKKKAVNDVKKESGDDKKKTEKEDDLSSKMRFRRVPFFKHSRKEDDDKENDTTVEESEEKTEKRYYSPAQRAIFGLFFEGDELEYARKWVFRVRTVLQFFIYMVEILYAILFITVISSVLFPLSDKLYDLLLNVLKVQSWYIYPFISLIFLQEICNVFNAPLMEMKEEKTEEEKKEESEAVKLEANLRALQSELKKRFDKDHSLRYYPETESEKPKEYVCTNVAYASALQYIRTHMEVTSGRVVESYIECLDAIYNDNHVYFAASFYSELGEYLTAYTYVRLLAGSRMMFVVSNEQERRTLKKYISERLMKMTGSSKNCTWRVYTSDERIDQADVFVATPSDFLDDNIVEQYPGFFEEVSNAVFIDADKMITFDSYLCLVMSSRLQKATDNRIKFIFLSLDMLKGFATGNLPKFFYVDKVLSLSSAKENEAVSYTLWNKESKRNRIYNKNGQTLTGLECIIAEQASVYGVDGVRLITQAPIDHADKEMLAMHKVEINNLYKDISDVNYMVYSDERCNLSAALYACTRFRGRKKSIVHIVSKPYLLREFFMSKAITKDYINRSSFIQPRVVEHAERHKLSLLRIFCDATSGKGLKISEFVERTRGVIAVALERGDYISSAFCRKMLENSPVSKLDYKQLAAYMLAGLYDNSEVKIENSIGKNAKDYYLVVDPNRQDGYNLQNEKYIVYNRVKEILEHLLEGNKRVELRLNDKIIGQLDTFPDRVNLEYIAGQSIIYDNAEYEIEQIAENGKTIYLRRENTNIKNCLDTVLLRRYAVNGLKQLGRTGVLHDTQSPLEEIRVSKYSADFVGETYGFYSLMTDRQTLDFYRGVEGNPHVNEKSVRNIKEGRLLKAELYAREECTDGMRLLLSAVFNEFVRTVFPTTYHCIAICPILENPLEFNDEKEAITEIDRIKALYPYLKDASGDFVETDKRRMQFLIINDCEQDVGALDWFYDQSARYMQEFLANVYSYLYWLKAHGDKQHYIYFGGKELPECYDLDGCCALLKDCNLILSDDGKYDYQTASADEPADETERCAFCHRTMESGRYSLFDNNRFICVDCFDVVDDRQNLDELYQSMRDYLEDNYPGISLGLAKPALDKVYELKKGQVLSENYYRLDGDQRIIYVERDLPETNVAISLLRGLIEFWQRDNDLIIPHATAQLYYEELIYLRKNGKQESADWIYQNLDQKLREYVDEITAYVAGEKEETEEEKETDGLKEGEVNGEGAGDNFAYGIRNSFTFMRERAAELDRKDDLYDENLDDIDDDFSDKLYDPNHTPRFWKRFLMNMDIDDGQEEKLEEDEDLSDEEELSDDEEIVNVNYGNVNAPDPYDGPVEEDGDTETGEDGESDTETDGEGMEDLSTDEQDGKKEKKQRKSLFSFFKGKKDKKKSTEEQLPIDGETDVEEDSDKTVDGEKGKKKKGLFSFLKGKKDKKKPNDDNPPVDDADTEKDTDDSADQEKGKKKKQEKPKKKKVAKKKLSPGEKVLPYEEDERDNPKIRFYNQLVRACYNYSEQPISREGLSDADVYKILTYVRCDYPELFWLGGKYSISQTEFKPIFRCRLANDEFDVKQVNEKRAALRKAAKKFTSGISRRTDPYKAALTIYRRLILTLDYDGKGLDAGAGKDLHKDDTLRSLYSALVEHKVVCAGYAVAMQYLLQSVGIVCGYVISEMDATGESCHAFNILKIGKYVYYLDATWGDASDTKTGESHKGLVKYNHFCVPYNEFVSVKREMQPYHIPRKEFYPEVKEYQYSNHEYFRYHKAYLNRYNEDEIVRIFAETACRYDPSEMGDFTVAFRCADSKLQNYAYSRLHEKGEIWNVLKKAKEYTAKTNKRASKLFDGKVSTWTYEEEAVLQFSIQQEKKK